MESALLLAIYASSCNVLQFFSFLKEFLKEFQDLEIKQRKIQKQQINYAFSSCRRNSKLIGIFFELLKKNFLKKVGRKF